MKKSEYNFLCKLIVVLNFAILAMQLAAVFLATIIYSFFEKDANDIFLFAGVSVFGSWVYKNQRAKFLRGETGFVPRLGYFGIDIPLVTSASPLFFTYFLEILPVYWALKFAINQLQSL